MPSVPGSVSWRIWENDKQQASSKFAPPPQTSLLTESNLLSAFEGKGRGERPLFESKPVKLNNPTSQYLDMLDKMDSTVFKPSEERRANPSFKQAQSVPRAQID